MISISETFGRLSSLLCLSLLHFLWQAVTVALVASVAGLALRQRSAQAEYIALVIGLALLPAAFAATLVWQSTRLPPAADPITMPLPATADAPTAAQAEMQSRSNQPNAPAEREPSAKVASATDVASAAPAAWDWHPIAPWLGAVYLFGVLAMCVRLLIGLGGARRLCCEATRVEDRGVLESLAQQCRRVGLRLAPPIAYCRDVSVPTLVGILRPTILLPLSAVSGLLPAELESILLHELVHIRRYDHLLNLGQRLVEAAFFFHPAVWFLSHRITAVREHCCDDAVLALGAQRTVYIESLMRVAELSVATDRLARQSAVAGLHATDKPSRLRQRIARLLDPPERTTLRLKPAALRFVGALVVGAVTTPLLLTALACHPQHRDQSVTAISDSPPPDSKNAAPKATAQAIHFSGIVVDKITQTPLAGAIVTLHRIQDRQPIQIELEESESDFVDFVKPEQIVTDTNGRYEFTITPEQMNQPRSFLDTEVRHPGYVPQEWNGAEPISSIVDDVQKGRHPWFERIAVIPGETVTAVIVDPQGKPLANCPIEFASTAEPKLIMASAETRPRRLYDKWVRNTTTDASGRFSFLAIKGADIVEFWARPKDFAILFKDVGEQRGDLGVLRLQAGTRLAGTVVDELGKPLRGVYLQVLSDWREAIEDRPMGRSTTTDDRGRFTFDPVDDGKYQVAVADGRFMPVRLEVSEKKPPSPIDFRPSPLTTVRVHFVDRRGKSVSGREPYSVGGPFCIGESLALSGAKGNASYHAVFHSTSGEAEARVPKGLEHVALTMDFPDDYLVFCRIGEHGDMRWWKYNSEFPLETLVGDSTEITIVGIKLPRLNLNAVGADGKPIAPLFMDLRYTDPALRHNVTISLPNGAKGIVAMGEFSAVIPKGYLCLPDQEFTVTGEAPGYQPASQKLKLSEGEARELTFKLATEAKKSLSDALNKAGFAKNLFSDISTGLSVAMAADDKTTGESKNPAAASQTSGDAKPKNAPPQKPRVGAGAEKTHFRSPENETTTKGTIRIHVVDADGRAIPAANILVGVWTVKMDFKHNADYTCDANGNVDVELPKKLYILRLWAKKDGYAPMFAHWESLLPTVLAIDGSPVVSAPLFVKWESQIPADQRVIPDEFTFPMKKGMVFGGVVKNEDGQPISGAKVEVMYASDHRDQRNRLLYNMWLSEGDDAVKTDVQGRWSLNNVPPGDKTEVRIKLIHPDYVSDFGWGESQQKQGVTIDSLRAKTATIVMHRGTRVTGMITDPDGKPISGALVIWGDDPYDDHHPQQEVLTDANGVYHLPPLPNGAMTVTVVAQGWMPQLRKIEIKSGMAPVDFQLKPGKTLRIKFVDSSGNAVPNVGVGIHGWRGGQSLYNYKHPNVLDSHVPVKADANGIYEWSWAPDDAVVYGFGTERLSVSGVAITADGEEHTQVLQSSSK